MKVLRFVSCFAVMAAACLFAAVEARAAAVSLVASDSNLIASDGGVTSLSSSFDMLTGNALVVSAPIRFGNPPTGTIDATFAGQTPDFEFIVQSGDRASVGTFVFLNPATTSGTVEVTTDSGARMGYAVYSLANVGGVLNTPDSDPLDGIATDGFGNAGSPEGFAENGNLDTTFRLQYAGDLDGYAIHTLAGEGPGSVTHEITGDNVDVTALSQQNGAGGIFLTAVSAGGQISAAGEFQTDFTYYRAGAMSTVVLTAIPEPTSLVLFGLGALGLACGRRR